MADKISETVYPLTIKSSYHTRKELLFYVRIPSVNQRNMLTTTGVKKVRYQEDEYIDIKPNVSNHYGGSIQYINFNLVKDIKQLRFDSDGRFHYGNFR